MCFSYIDFFIIIASAFINRIAKPIVRIHMRLCRINPEKLCQHVEQNLVPYLQPATCIISVS